MYYIYERIKNDRANLRKQGMELVLAKFSENPGLSPEELKKAVMDDLQDGGRRNGDRATNR